MKQYIHGHMSPFLTKPKVSIFSKTDGDLCALQIFVSFYMFTGMYITIKIMKST